MPEIPVLNDCTPSALLASSPCAACLSEKEMIAAIVAIFVIAAETTVTQALKDSACFTCMSKKQMLQALVTILGNNILGENASQQEILNMLACLRCASERQLMAAALYLLCHEFALERQGI